MLEECRWCHSSPRVRTPSLATAPSSSIPSCIAGQATAAPSHTRYNCRPTATAQCCYEGTTRLRPQINASPNSSHQKRIIAVSTATQPHMAKRFGRPPASACKDPTMLVNLARPFPRAARTRTVIPPPSPPVERPFLTGEVASPRPLRLRREGGGGGVRRPWALPVVRLTERRYPRHCLRRVSTAP